MTNSKFMLKFNAENSFSLKLLKIADDKEKKLSLIRWRECIGLTSNAKFYFITSTANRLWTVLWFTKVALILLIFHPIFGENSINVVAPRCIRLDTSLVDF